MDKASEELGVEVIHWMPHAPEELGFFYSTFDPKVRVESRNLRK